VALEVTGNTWAIATLLASRAGRVVVSNPAKTRAIAEAKVKTDAVLRHPRQRSGRSSLLRCGRCAWTPAADAARPNTPETTRKNGHNDHKTRLDWFRRFRDDPGSGPTS
jgi:hypothetical protein